MVTRSLYSKYKKLQLFFYASGLKRFKTKKINHVSRAISSPVLVANESSCEPLLLFTFSDIVLSVLIPQTRSILKTRPDHSLVSGKLNLCWDSTYTSAVTCLSSV